jgi:glycosyltransferase involved in cell wall biosynthesis
MGFSEEQLFYAPYGINREEFSSTSPDWDSHETFAIANARAFKNIEAQIRAVDILKDEIADYHHHLIGGWGEGGEYRDRIERMIAKRELDDAVTIHGFVPREEMFDIMSGCQAFLHTSHFETEGLVLYEAAAAGFPICTSDNPVHNQNFNRFLHPDSDHEKLAADVKDLFDKDISEKEDRAEDMRQKAKDFGIETERQRLDELFAELTNHE